MRGQQRGYERERKVRAVLEDGGWVTLRAAGSLGPVDVVAIATGFGIEHPLWPGKRIHLERAVLFIEVKSTADGPYKNFSPGDRQLIRSTAERAGAEALLCWWPPRKPAKWIASQDWPAQRIGVAA